MERSIATNWPCRFNNNNCYVFGTNIECHPLRDITSCDDTVQLASGQRSGMFYTDTLTHRLLEHSCWQVWHTAFGFDLHLSSFDSSRVMWNIVNVNSVPTSVAGSAMQASKNDSGSTMFWYFLWCCKPLWMKVFLCCCDIFAYGFKMSAIYLTMLFPVK